MSRASSVMCKNSASSIPSYNFDNNFSHNNNNSADTNLQSNLTVLTKSFDLALLQPRRKPIRIRSGMHSKQASRSHSAINSSRANNLNTSTSATTNNTSQQKDRIDQKMCASTGCLCNDEMGDHDDDDNNDNNNDDDVSVHNFMQSNTNDLTILSEEKAMNSKSLKSPLVTKDDKKRFIYAIDHLSTKLQIPMCAVEPTMAMEDDGLVPGLCRLYMEGRCRQGERCYQVHANPAVLSQLRAIALETPSCCHVHGAECNFEDFPPGLTVTIEAIKDKELLNSHEEHNWRRELLNFRSSSEIYEASTTSLNSLTKLKAENVIRDTTPVIESPATEYKPVIVPLTSLNPTNFLWKLYRDSGTLHLHTTLARVCREHRKGLCKFGDECNFLHVCREIHLECTDKYTNLSRNASINNISRHWSESTTFDNTPRHYSENYKTNMSSNNPSRTQSLHFGEDKFSTFHYNNSARQKGKEKLLESYNSMPDFYESNNTFGVNGNRDIAYNNSRDSVQSKSRVQNYVCNNPVFGSLLQLSSSVKKYPEDINVNVSCDSSIIHSQPVRSTSGQPSFHKTTVVNNFMNNNSIINDLSISKPENNNVAKEECNKIEYENSKHEFKQSNEVNEEKQLSSHSCDNLVSVNAVVDNSVILTPAVEKRTVKTIDKRTLVINTTINDTFNGIAFSGTKEQSESNIFASARNKSSPFVGNFSLSGSAANSFAEFVSVKNVNSTYSEENFIDNTNEQNTFNRLLCPLSSHSQTPVTTPLTQKSFSHNPYGVTRSMN